MHFDAFDFCFVSFRTYSIVLIAIVIVLAIPIFGLTGFHMVLVSRGRTTNEQVTGKFKGGYNPFSRGCWHNCCYTQFGPQYPRSVFVRVHVHVRAQWWQCLIINLCADSYGYIVFRFELCSHNLFSRSHTRTNSLMKPQKYTACRTTKENQTISTITNEEQRHAGNNAVQHSNVYEVDQSTQVKTYTDHGNGYGQRSGGTTHYSKVSSIRSTTASQRKNDTHAIDFFFCICSFRPAVNVTCLIWIHRVHKAKIVSRRHRCNGIIRISICLQWRENHHGTFECIMHVIVLMRDKGHYYFAKTTTLLFLFST